MKSYISRKFPLETRITERTFELFSLMLISPGACSLGGADLVHANFCDQFRSDRILAQTRFGLTKTFGCPRLYSTSAESSARCVGKELRRRRSARGILIGWQRPCMDVSEDVAPIGMS